MCHGWLPMRSSLPDLSWRKRLKESKGPEELYLSSCLECAPNLLGHMASLRKQSPWQSVSLFRKYLWLFTPAAFQVSSHSNDLGTREQMKYPHHIHRLHINASILCTSANRIHRKENGRLSELLGMLNFIKYTYGLNMSGNVNPVTCLRNTHNKTREIDLKTFFKHIVPTAPL